MLALNELVVTDKIRLRDLRARVAADPELQSEYETQLAVSSLLGDAPAPTMTAAERSELRTALRQQLNLHEAPPPAVVAPSRWQRWWAPVAGLAAAAAVIVLNVDPGL